MCSVPPRVEGVERLLLFSDIVLFADERRAEGLRVCTGVYLDLTEVTKPGGQSVRLSLGSVTRPVHLTTRAPFAGDHDAGPVLCSLCYLK
jgi:hypothetical protein